MGRDEYIVFLTAGLGAFISVLGFLGAWIIKATTKNTEAIIKLTEQMQGLHTRFESVENLQRDITQLKDWKRKHEKPNGSY